VAAPDAGTLGGLDRRGQDLLVKLYEENEIPDTVEIARAIGKSVSAVTSYASRGLTSKSPKAKLRACMMCDEAFMSDGPGNCICDGCKRTELYRCA
jgi:hypothetical protein